MFNGAFKFQIFNMRRYGMGLQGSGSDNVLRSAYLKDRDVWSGGGVISSYFLERGDYFKLENVTLGYTVPLKTASSLTPSACTSLPRTSSPSPATPVQTPRQSHLPA